jgi:hypothetical protein
MKMKRIIESINSDVEKSYFIQHESSVQKIPVDTQIKDKSFTKKYSDSLIKIRLNTKNKSLQKK